MGLKTIGTILVVVGVLVFAYGLYGQYSISYLQSNTNTYCVSGAINPNGYYHYTCSYGFVTINGNSSTQTINSDTISVLSSTMGIAFDGALLFGVLLGIAGYVLRKKSK